MIAVLIAAIWRPASASVPVQATCPPYGTCPNSDSSTNNNLLYIGTAVALAIIVAAIAAALLIRRRRGGGGAQGPMTPYTPSGGEPIATRPAQPRLLPHRVGPFRSMPLRQHRHGGAAVGAAAGTGASPSPEPPAYVEGPEDFGGRPRRFLLPLRRGAPQAQRPVRRPPREAKPTLTPS